MAIARVLAQRSRVLLADEPVSSLDPKAADNVLTVLRSVARENGIAVLCSLHQVDLARRFADRVVALRGGRLVLDAPAAALTPAAFAEIYGTPEPPAGETHPSCDAPPRIAAA